MRRTLALALAVPLTLALVASETDLNGTSTVPGAAPAPRPSESAVASQTTTSTTAILTPAPSPAPFPTPSPSDPDAEGTVGKDLPATSSTSGNAVERATPVDRDAPVETTFLVADAPATGAVAGSGSRWRYTVEVEPGLGIDLESLALEVREALTNDRSWARTRTLEQVSEPSQARIRVVLASPETVDELCGRAGLRTAGIYSCWNGRFAALNSWRWEFGADGFEDIRTYRNYLVNHEFGHGLGYGHVSCPGAGEPAPVMMQQSKGLGDCVANGWPYP